MIKIFPSFAHGAHPPENKWTAAMPVRRFPFAPLLLVPMAQHAGKPAVPIVRADQAVRRGEIIARADGFRSVPMHAPVTGTVRRIGPGPTASGELAETIYIETLPASTQTEIEPTPPGLSGLDRDQVIQKIQDAGIVGMGGAGFPTHAKLKSPPDKPVELCIVNGAECEPYLTSDHRVMLERADDVLRGLELLMRAVCAKSAIIAIEANKADAVAALRRAIPPGSPVRVQVVATKYPEGAAHILIKSLLGREVPRGGHSYDVGVEVSNVATVAEIGKLLPTGRGLIERVLTVSGPGVPKPGNYLIPLGTPLRFILEQTGVRLDGSLRVVLGGPMMGRALSALDVPITKADTGILVFPGSETVEREMPCIRCGLCVEACPLFLNPARLGLLARQERFVEMASDYNLFTCFECGTCAFVCPSRIPLTQYFRMAKASEKKRERAATDLAR